MKQETNLSNQIEEERKIPVKFIIHSGGWFMCATNWSKSYSAGVMEFKSKEEAEKAGRARTKEAIDVYEFNNKGERIN